MKILYVMRNIWGGGAPKRFWMTHNALAQKGFDITLLATPNTSTYQKFNPQEFSDIKIISLTLPQHFSDYLFYLKAAKLIRKIGYHFDIIHDDFSPVAPYSFFWHNNTIAMVHEIFGPSSMQRYNIAGLLPLINERFYQKMGYKIFITPSHSTAEKLRELGVNSVVVPNGVDVNLFSPNQNTREDEDIVISMVARFTPVKGHIFFLNMAKKLYRSHKNIKFILPSTGPLHSEIKRLANQANLPIFFPGFLKTEKDIVKTLQKSDIYISTSLQEGFGISVCEAMSCQLPIVTFDAAGVKDSVTPECGFRIPVGDVDQLVDKVKVLIKDEELRKEMGQHSRERILKHFTWEKASKKLSNVYYKIHN